MSSCLHLHLETSLKLLHGVYGNLDASNYLAHNLKSVEVANV